MTRKCYKGPWPTRALVAVLAPGFADIFRKELPYQLCKVS